LRTNSTDRLTIKGDGNVGIGTSTVATKFVVSADATDSDVGQLRVIGSTSTAKMTNVGYHTTNNYGFIQALIAGTGYSNLALQPNGGNVGIGTTVPAYKLDVSGSANITGSLTAGRLLIGTVTSGTAAGDGVVKLGTYGHCISQNGAAVVSGSYVDLTVNTTGTGYQGFLTVANTQESNAAVRTQTTFSVFGRGASATFTTIATADGPTAGASFTVTTPSNGVIRITNTIGFPTSISVQFFGGTSF